MAEYRNEDGTTTVVERRTGPGLIIGIIVALAVIIVAFLFLTGFWSADVKRSGSLPDVHVSAEGGSLPKVDVHSKEVVVGTKATKVTVPKVESTQTTVDVPVVGVKDGK
ncbi:MAG: hypothetical protein JWL96_1180 [Sphingomonas bacterium]|jgi:hypothetical protein|uniref:hypothetical protein n=1 Tax=Sphingomonas bacterium TaxID=1895847 RepID=UPI0026268FA4|nr:hypothetical protein [Sphingomonas bacterium]MDB5709110.1 hypothetical protein [Sphingomonas bacterium]